jgi:hypothetical protein
VLDWGMNQNPSGDAAPHTMPAIHREIFHPRLAQELIDRLQKALFVPAQRSSSPVVVRFVQAPASPPTENNNQAPPANSEHAP